MNLRFLLVLGLVCASSLLPGSGHTLPISFLRIVPDADFLHLELTFNPFELTFATELDQNKNGRIDPKEWEEQQGIVTQRILDCLKIEVDGKRVKADVSGVTPDMDSHHATLRAHYPVDARAWPVRVESALGSITSGSHLTQVTFGSEGRLQYAQLDAQSTVATFEPLNPPGSDSIRLPARATARWAGQGKILLPGLIIVAVVLGVALWAARVGLSANPRSAEKGPHLADQNDKAS